MAVTHVDATRNTLANAVCDQLNTGFLEFRTAGDAEVAKLTFNATAFDDAPATAVGKCTANAIVSDTSALGGTVAKAALLTSGDADIVLMDNITTTSGGGDIELSSLDIGTDDTVSCSALTYEAAA
jgi:hypothetical protein